jgi:hypothetical protein
MGRKVEVAGRNYDTLPILYQVAEGPFWWGGDHVFKGMPPRASGEAYGHILIPDRLAPRCYAFDEHYMTCHALDGAMTEVAKLRTKWPERFERSPREGPLFTTDRVEDSHRHLAATVDGQFHCFIWSKAEQCVYHGTAKAFGAGCPSDTASGTVEEGPLTVFPLRIEVGEQIEYRLVPDGTKGEYRVIDAPAGVEITERGLLTWTPTKADLGVQRLKIRVTVDGRSEFVRLSTDVIPPTGKRRPSAGRATKGSPDKKPGIIRNWRDRTGQFGVLAQFVSVTDGKVKLRRADGTEIAVSFRYVAEAGGPLDGQ